MPTRISESKTCRNARRRGWCLRSAPLLAAFLFAAAGGVVALASPPQWRDARCPRYSGAQAVFVGRVLGFERVTLPVNWGLGGGEETLRLVRFAVEERFKGADGKEVNVLTPLESVNARMKCEDDFEEGGRYLVYAYSWFRQPELRTFFCRDAKRLAEAGDDLSYLRGFLKGEPLAEISGKVEHYRLDIKTWRLNLVRSLAGVRVTADGEGRHLETRTDDAGKYHFGGLAPGNYQVKIDGPPGLYSPLPERPVELARTACDEADFRLHTDRRVAGRVADTSGRPVSGVGLHLVLADNFPHDESLINEESLRGMSGVADADGRFEIRGVPPGRYLLGVNLHGINDAPIEWNPPPVFPRTYFPGTGERTAATVIELREGQSVSGLEMTLVPPPATALVRREIKGTVVLSDGRPAPCAMVSIIDAKYAKTRGGHGEFRVGEGGRFTLHGYEGYSYAVQAYVPVIDERGRNVGSVAAEPVIVSPSQAAAPVRLVTRPTGNCDFMTRGPR